MTRHTLYKQTQKSMAKVEVIGQDVKETIKALVSYRSGWANSIREGWNSSMPGAKEIIYELYEISGTIILALQQISDGNYRDKMAMVMTEQKLEKLVKSDMFGDFSALGEANIAHVVTSATNHHIRVMFECLRVLTA